MIDNYDLYMEWKDQYGEVFMTTVNEMDFYFRLISKKEFNTLKSLETNDHTIDDMIATLCVLDPIIDDWGGEIFAGVTETLARCILEESLVIFKPGEDEHALKNRINKDLDLISNKFERQIPLIIIKAFPAYTVEEINEWSLRKQVERYTEAVWVLNELDNYGIEFEE